MAKVVNLNEAKSQLASLVEEAAAGTRSSSPRPACPARGWRQSKPSCVVGLAGRKGRIRIAADFDAPLPARVLAAFTGRKR